MKIFLVIFLLLSFNNLSAQRQAENWLYGWHNKVNFANSIPVYTNTNPPSPIYMSYAANACMSDKNGNFLYAYNGEWVYDRNYDVMTNSNGISAINNNLGGQGGITIPFPGSDSLYYLFYINYAPSQFISNYLPPRLKYSVINMNLQGGLGEVIEKNTGLFGTDSVCVKITATLHCNKKDVWVLGHRKNSDQYFSLLVTPSGINATPVYSAGDMIDENGLFGNLYNHWGYMKVSPGGDKVAATFGGQKDFIEIGDFNNQTGAITNIKKLVVRPPEALVNPNNLPGAPYGVEFSPSGRYLYISANYEIQWPSCGCNRYGGYLFQFDLSSNNQAAIQASMVRIDKKEAGYYGLQLAPDGKIYLAADQDTLKVINNPENAGLACNFQRNAFFHNTGNTSGYDLPNFLQNYLRFPVIATGNCQFQNITFNIQNLAGVSSIAWDFGDPASGINNFSSSFSPTHIFTGPGAYNIKAVVQNSNGCGADTIRKVIYAGQYKVFLGNDTTFCTGDSLRLRLSMNIPGAGILWSNGSRDTTLTVKQPGTYWVRANLGDCIASDTIVVGVRNLPQFSLGNDTLICGNISLPLLPNPTYSPASYLWNTNAITQNINVNIPGDYWLRLTDANGCIWRDTVNVSFKQLPNYSLGNDTAICQQDTLVLNASVSGATNYTWSMGATNPQIKAYQSGIYWCDVNKDGCTYRDSITLNVKPLPIVNLGTDTTLCENTTLFLDAQNPGSSWLWNTGTFAQTYLVRQAGLYKVTVTKNNCIGKDSISISYELKPRFTLGADRLICPGEIIILQPVLDPLWQLKWQDGSGAITYRVAQPGLYYLDATTHCGTTTEDIVFTRGICKINIPNTFTPNGDGRNDVLKALGTEVVTAFNMKIFNRYGQLVFETKNKGEGWNGKFKGANQPQGVYAWFIQYAEVTNTTPQILNGTVLLVR